MNETATNETNTSAIWQVPEDISGVQKIFEEAQRISSELLVSWEMIPEDVYFRMLIILAGVVLIYQLFVTGTSKTGGAFRYILMLVIVFAVLVALGIL